MSNDKTIDVEKIWLKRIRAFIGILGMILPWLALLGAVLVARTTRVPDNFWEDLSISATYYITPPLVGVLTAAAIILMCYKGYDWRDHAITALSGVFGAMIVIFPCKCAISGELVGFFQLPVNVSHIIHCVSAVLFFILLAINSMFLFTLGESNTKNKKIKNIIFRVCAVGMLCGLVFIPLPIEFPAKIFISETIALTFFAVSWLVKAEIFGLLSDK
ncbi:hypothetical protein [Fibrobacter sp.]|uniref:hypothetical protein n=1 Tax=Fibrobacter sp. TaxID=35828 RepID=UPI001B053BB7|nr:hypothetical protein [Fibrobacter sp.]MBO7062149.1 hypothetical protein [Fibrobacter sp.]